MPGINSNTADPGGLKLKQKKFPGIIRQKGGRHMVESVKKTKRSGVIVAQPGGIKSSVAIVVSTFLGLSASMAYERGHFLSSLPQIWGIYVNVLFFQIVIAAMCIYPAIEISFARRYFFPASLVTFIVAVYFIMGTADVSFLLFFSLLVNKGIQAKHFDRLLI